MTKLFVLMGLVFTLSACEEKFNGQLDLGKSIQFVGKLDRDTQRQLDRCERRNSRSSKCKRLYKKKEGASSILTAGQYRAQLIPGKSKVKMKVKNEKGKTIQEFNVKVPKHARLPRENGSFNLLSADTSFPYDIKGNLVTEITRTDTVYSNESCTWTEPETVCRRVLEAIPNCDPALVKKKKRKNPCMRRVRKCETEYITYHGYQDVEFHHKHTDKDIVFSMIKPSTREGIGEFQGHYHDAEKIYTYKQTCN
ncbi:MAG: hypothetical protein AB8E15_09140 [Bdellovibrionales bacterium]